MQNKNKSNFQKIGDIDIDILVLDIVFQLVVQFMQL